MNKYVFSSLPQFTKLARDLRVPGEKKVKAPKAESGLDAEAAALSINEEEDDEYAGGLC